MSLYGGIKFTSGETDTSLPDDNAAGPSSSTAPSTSTNAVQGHNSKQNTISSKDKADGGWSAALKFAPRLNKPKVGSGRPGNSVSSTTYSAEPMVKYSTTSVSVEPADSSRQSSVHDEVMFNSDGKPLAKAPAMTLSAQNQNQNRNSGQNKRDREWDDGHKKKKKKKKKRPQLMASFDPDEMYDPNRPNDLGEYQQYRKRLREEKRARLFEEKRRKADGRGSSDESSYYTDSEEDVPRRDAPKMFAPRYSPPPNVRPPPPPSSSNHQPPPPPRPSNEVDDEDDDPYERRAAISKQPATGDDAYARRAALSQVASGDDAYARRAAMSQVASGDDAYARRVAMSSSVPSSAPPPMPPSRPAPSDSAPPPPPPMPAAVPDGSSDIPGFGLTNSVLNLPETSNSVTAAVEPATGPGTEDFAKLLEEKRKAAEAIAAKLRALAPGAAPVPVPLAEKKEESGSFAEKMMKRWGHKEGTGLGAQGTGIVHALTAEHVVNAKPVDPNAPLSKRQLAKQKAAAANAKNKNRKWVQHAHARGKIVDANEDARKKEEKGKYGEASRVVCLVGMVGDIDEVDEDMTDEIGEECSKFGIVERVVLHMVEPPPPEPSECLRVFIVYSGMAGAWRALKELDGRAYGGRRIRATYFDETKFDAGQRDGPILT